MMRYGDLLDRINHLEAKICVVGLGYVGVPVLRAFKQAQFPVVGYDSNSERARQVEQETGITCDGFCSVSADVYIVCVPTPVNGKTPDLFCLQSAARDIPKDRFVIVESTVGPGDTERTFDGQAFLAFSPEREDPGTGKDLTTIPKIIASNTYEGQLLISTLYSRVFKGVLHMTRDIKTAEMAKLMENTYRAVNIALACEFRDAAEVLGIDAREATRAAATKPFGYQAFNAGIGVGGHCIPVDPYYLLHNVQEALGQDKTAPLKRLSIIKQALETNANMPYEIAYKLLSVLPVEDSNVLVLGVTYKKNIDDVRNSPAVDLIKRLAADATVRVTWFDEQAPQEFDIRHTTRVLTLPRENVFDYDMVVLAVNHSDFDYSVLHGHPCIYDLTGHLPPNEPNIRRL